MAPRGISEALATWTRPEPLPSDLSSDDSLRPSAILAFSLFFKNVFNDTISGRPRTASCPKVTQCGQSADDENPHGQLSVPSPGAVLEPSAPKSRRQEERHVS